MRASAANRLAEYQNEDRHHPMPGVRRTIRNRVIEYDTTAMVGAIEATQRPWVPT